MDVHVFQMIFLLLYPFPLFHMQLSSLIQHPQIWLLSTSSKEFFLTFPGGLSTNYICSLRAIIILSHWFLIIWAFLSIRLWALEHNDSFSVSVTTFFAYCKWIVNKYLQGKINDQFLLYYVSIIQKLHENTFFLRVIANIVMNLIFITSNKFMFIVNAQLEIIHGRYKHHNR